MAREKYDALKDFRDRLAARQAYRDSLKEREGKEFLTRWEFRELHPYTNIFPLWRSTGKLMNPEF